MMRIRFYLLVIIVLVLNSFAEIQAQNRYVPTFSFEPSTRTQVANTGIAIALISPYFADINTSELVEELEEFQKAMEGELEELLIAKGFKVRGPYKTRDEMVFQDKKNTDFTLKVSVGWSAKLSRELKKIFGPGQFKTKRGELNISRSVELIAISNFTGEKLWKKRFQLSPKTIVWKGAKDLGPNADRMSFWDELRKDPVLSEPFGQVLEDTFRDILDILWKQVDVEEVRAIAEQAKLERSKDRQQR